LLLHLLIHSVVVVGGIVVVNDSDYSDIMWYCCEFVENYSIDDYLLLPIDIEAGGMIFLYGSTGAVVLRRAGGSRHASRISHVRHWTRRARIYVACSPCMPAVRVAASACRDAFACMYVARELLLRDLCLWLSADVYCHALWACSCYTSDLCAIYRGLPTAGGSGRLRTALRVRWHERVHDARIYFARFI